MEQRTFKKIDVQVSPIGFGCMRFPLEDPKDESSIREEEAMRMLRGAIDGGLNYVDTAWPYHGFASEKFVGRALGDGYREKVHLATKLPIWEVKEEADVFKFLDQQLDNLKTDHIDFYLVHALDKERWETVLKFNVLPQLERAKALGKIKYVGFSFHDDYETFVKIVDGYDSWDFYQIQFNYINTDYQAGVKGLEYAGEKGLSAVIMEPLLGGKLANPSPQVAEKLSPQRTPVEWALDYLWSFDQVAVVLSGMSDETQVRDNLTYGERWKERKLSDEQRKMLQEAKEVFDRMALVPCTGCAYCMPCPFGLEIPRLMEAYNQTASRGMDRARKTYEELSVKADSCKACGHCEKECPQHIPVSQVMKTVAEVFGK